MSNMYLYEDVIAQVVNAIHGVIRNGYLFSIYTLQNLSSLLTITIEIMELMEMIY